MASINGFLAEELKRLDLLLHREILRLRARYQLSLDEFRGLYISDQQVDALVDRHLSGEADAGTLHALEAEAQELRQTNRDSLLPDDPWNRLVAEFELSVFEQDVILLTLAPELEPKYETLSAYLNNDVSRKQPTHDLALNLFSQNPEQRHDHRRALLPDSRLYRSGLLQATGDGQGNWLSTGLKLTPAVADFLLGLPSTGRLPPLATALNPKQTWDQLPLSPELASRMQHLPLLFRDAQNGVPPVIVLVGHRGAGRTTAVEAFARSLGMSLLEVDLQMVTVDATNAALFRELALQQRLLNAVLYFRNLQVLFSESGKPSPEARTAFRSLADGERPLCLASEPGLRWQELLSQRAFLHFDFSPPEYTERRRLWSSGLDHAGLTAPDADVEALSERFVLNPGQIRDAVIWLDHTRHLNGKAIGHGLHAELLFDAARTVSSGQLGKLAVKVDSRFSWEELVLPPTLLGRVQEVAAAIKHRKLVYSEWGMAQRFADGGGLKVLFSGASGTGKTMTASVLARDLGLDLYKIDLSGIVSKYIGETEKNLDEIFRAAQSSNAILFFDEADALFGKRSEVKDAHDRYANIEVAYLLQKMEEFDGVVILASNLSKNIDQAFSRRMHYAIEFPRPGKEHREQLWRGMFPDKTPLGNDVDFPFLARQFELTGGDIKTVVLDAAFMAAENDKVIRMEQLVKAMAKQMVKQGKMPGATEFKQYHGLLSSVHSIHRE